MPNLDAIRANVQRVSVALDTAATASGALGILRSTVPIKLPAVVADRFIGPQPRDQAAHYMMKAVETLTDDIRARAIDLAEADFAQASETLFPMEAITA